MNISAASALDQKGADLQPPSSILTRSRCHGLLILAMLLLLLMRVAMITLIPLADTTEARYGEIARLTVTHGFWLMPHVEVDLPFFAKPPLSTWTSAAVMTLFGINEFAARLPSLLMAIATGFVAMAFCRELGVQRRWLVFPILAASPLFLMVAGTVMTDSTEGLTVTTALYFAWRAISAPPEKSTGWRMGFWAMVGVGALCKGLANWALIGLPLILYAIVERQMWGTFLKLFAWSGVILAALICVPWYLTAEHYYHGFLNYFIIGEHFSRFLVPGWKGDRYGNAHPEPLGMIWAYWAGAILPWIGVFATRLTKNLFGKSPKLLPVEKFLWCATLAPLLFFTAAHNIIWTYALTALIPFAILTARWLDQSSDRMLKIVSVGLMLGAIAFAAAFPAIRENLNGNSDHDLIEVFTKTAPADAKLVYLNRPWHSSRFYGHDRVINAEGHSAAEFPPTATQPAYLVIDNAALPNPLPTGWTLLFRGTRHSLFEVRQ